MATPSGEVGLLTPEGHGSTGRIGAAASSAHCPPSGEVSLLTPEGHGSTRLGDTIEAGFVEFLVSTNLAHVATVGIASRRSDTRRRSSVVALSAA